MVHSLASGEKHIPYRDSKLTHLLQARTYSRLTSKHIRYLQGCRRGLTPDLLLKHVLYLQGCRRGLTPDLLLKHVLFLQGCVRFVLQALAVPSASDFAAESFRALCVHGRKQLATRECIEQACHTMMVTRLSSDYRLITD